MDSGFVLVGLLIFFAFVGYKIIDKVPSLLHTPLMSGMNAFSGITLLGCMTIMPYAAQAGEIFSRIIGILAITLATINIVAGFAVTNRMLHMFKKDRR